MEKRKVEEKVRESEGHTLTFLTLVTVRVTGEEPQLKVITPPVATALVKAASVQLAAVPVPTY